MADNCGGAPACVMEVEFIFQLYLVNGQICIFLSSAQFQLEWRPVTAVIAVRRHVLIPAAN